MKRRTEKNTANKKDGTSTLSPQFFGANSRPKWQTHYLVISFLVGMFLYSFEAAQIMFFEHFRAPNVRLLTQLFLTFVFYTLWAIVPRIIWYVFDKIETRSQRTIGVSVICLAIAGLLLSLLHLAFLALMKLYMYAQVPWGIGQILTSSAELWLGYCGFWLILFVLSCLVIYLVRTRIRRRPGMKIEVRKNGRVFVLLPENILWIEAAGNYIQIYATNGLFTLRGSLAKIEADMGEDDFFRAHRQALINIRHVQSIKSAAAQQNKDAQNSYGVELSDGTTAPLARRKLAVLKSLLHAH